MPLAPGSTSSGGSIPCRPGPASAPAIFEDLVILGFSTGEGPKGICETTLYMTSCVGKLSEADIDKAMALASSLEMRLAFEAAQRLATNAALANPHKASVTIMPAKNMTARDAKPRVDVFVEIQNGRHFLAPARGFPETWRLENDKWVLEKKASYMFMSL